MAQLVIAALACALLVALPFCSFLANNYTDPSFIPREFLRFAAVNIAIILVVLAVTGLIVWMAARRKTAVLAGFLVAGGVVFYLLFTFRPLAVWIDPNGSRAVSASLHIFFVLIAGAVVWSVARHPVVAIASAAFAAVNIVASVPALTETLAAAAQGGNQEQARTGGQRTADLPNIYYLILDAYPSVSSLKSTLGFDNTGFIAQMERRGFYHAADVRSSYNQTTLTLSSIMAGDYFFDDTTPKSERRRVQDDLIYPRLLTGQTPPPTVVAAQEIGYEFIVVGNHWGRCAGPYVSCYPGNAASSYLSETFWSATPAAFLVEVASGRAGKKVDVDAIGKVVERLERHGPPSVPTFTFVHHLSPHPPYLFNANCELRESYKVDFKSWSEAARPYFIDNLTCTNQKALELADTILASDPDAIIVFQGDHGSAFTVPWDAPFEEWPQAAIHERSSVLNLIRLPNRCISTLHPRIDNVNTVRAVLSCVGGSGRPDKVRSFVATYSKVSPDTGALREIDPQTDQLLPIE